MSRFIDASLILAWTSRTIRGRYQQSLLGWLWAIIQPAFSVAILTVVFTRFVRVDTGDTPYVLFSFVGVVPWTLLSTSLTDMTESLVSNMNLITKISLNRQSLPIAAMLARLVDFLVAGAAFLILLIFYDRPVFQLSWIFLPLVLTLQIALILGVGLFGSALNVFYRDVKSVLALGIQLWFYASPIIYPVSIVPERLQEIYFINPMAGFLESYRDILIHGRTPGFGLLVGGAISVAILLLGVAFFKKVEHRFADIV